MNKKFNDNVDVIAKLCLFGITIAIPTYGLVTLQNPSATDTKSTSDYLFPYLFYTLLAISAYEVIQAFSVRIKRNQFDQINNALSKIEQQKADTFTIQTSLLSAHPDFYRIVWGGFATKNYFAFNPAYRIEKNTRKEVIEEIIDLFKTRFNEQVQAEYVFLTKDTGTMIEIDDGTGKKTNVDKGQIDLLTFRALMALADSKKKIENRNNLTVKVIDTENADLYGEFYFGTKYTSNGDQQDTTVYETTRTANDERGASNHYVITSNPQVCEFFKNRYDAWSKKAKPIDFWALSVHKKLVEK